MFKLDPKERYMMPAHFGPRTVHEKASRWYRDVTTMVVSYITDRDKLAAYLPEPYEVAGQAVVTVVYACNKQVDWLAGHGYNLIGVNASAVYKGDKEQLTGSYALVLWENLTDAILVGREVQGIPKIYADIPEHSIIDGTWRCNASHFGHSIVDMSIQNLRPVTAEEIAAQQQATQGRDHQMSWRYLPAVTGFGPPAVNEALTYPSDSQYTEVLVGEGTVDWQQLSWEQNPTQFHIVNALADLPVLQYLPAVVTRGSTNLVVPESGGTRSLG